MTCHELTNHLDAFLDEELSVIKTLKLRGHLAFCGRCRTVVESEVKIRTLIRAEALQEAAPVHLREQIVRAIEGEPAREGRQRRKSLLRRRAPLLSLLAGATIAAGLVLTLTLRSAREGPSLATELVKQHLTLNQGETALDLVSQDPSQIAAWLRTKLDFPFKLPPLARSGEKLVGAKLSSFASVQAAQLLYERAGQKTSLFIFRESSSIRDIADFVREVEGVKFPIAKHRGYSVVWWEDEEQGVYYAAVSDAGVDDLIEFSLICVKGKERLPSSGTPSSRGS